jgi:hypothetical protein
VHDRYRATVNLRHSLRKWIKHSVIAYLAILLVSAYAYVSWGFFVYHPLFYVTILSPVLGDHAAHKSKYFLLLAYSTITSFASAFVLAFGFGDALRKIAQGGFDHLDAWHVFMLVFNAAAFAVLITCVFKARALLPFFKFELQNKKK